MLNFNKFFAAVSIAVLTFFGLGAAPAMAEHHEKNMSMISIVEVNPAMEKQWAEAWNTVREIATKEGYPHELYVATNRNERWFVSPISGFADIDSIFSARGEIYKSGGKKFQKAIADMQAAELTSRSFVTRHDTALSYGPEGASRGPAMEIDTYYYRSGQGEEMGAIFADYKKLSEELEMPNAYDVYWNGLGSEGNSITTVTYGESQLAIAQANAEDDAKMDGNEDRSKLFERFLKISLSSETERATQRPNLSIVPASPEE